jgi:hypothetical protein
VQHGEMDEQSSEQRAFDTALSIAIALAGIVASAYAAILITN